MTYYNRHRAVKEYDVLEDLMEQEGMTTWDVTLLTAQDELKQATNDEKSVKELITWYFELKKADWKQDKVLAEYALKIKELAKNIESKDVWVNKFKHLRIEEKVGQKGTKYKKVVFG